MVASHRRDEPVRRATFRILSALIVAGGGLGIALGINDAVTKDQATPARASDSAYRGRAQMTMPPEFLLETAPPSPAATPLPSIAPAPSDSTAAPALVASTLTWPQTASRATPGGSTPAPKPTQPKPTTPAPAPTTPAPAPSPTTPAPAPSPSPSPSPEPPPAPSPSPTPPAPSPSPTP